MSRWLHRPSPIRRLVSASAVLAGGVLAVALATAPSASASGGYGTASSPPSISTGLMTLDQGAVFTNPHTAASCPSTDCNYDAPELASAHFSGSHGTWLFRTVSENVGDNTDPTTKHTEFMRAQLVGSNKLNWTPFTVVGRTEIDSNLAFAGNMAQNGDLLYMFGSRSTQQVAGSSHTFLLPRYVSADYGARFVQPASGASVGSGYGIVTLSGIDPSRVSQVFAYQGIHQLGAAWLMPVYAGGHVFLTSSTDQGQHWNQVADVFTPGTPTHAAYSEATIGQLPNGHLVMAARTDTNNSLTNPDQCGAGKNTDGRYKACNTTGLLFFRQTKGAVTASTPLSTLSSADAWTPIYAAHSSTSGKPAITYGSSPVMVRAGKYLMLGYGRPGEHLSFSSDGVNWTTPGDGFFSNRPAQAASSACHSDIEHISCQAVGAQGYLGLVAVDSDYDATGAFATGFVAFDSCGPWSCKAGYVPPGSYTFPQGTTPRVTVMRWTMTVHGPTA